MIDDIYETGPSIFVKRFLHLGQEFYGERLQDGWKFIRAEQLSREAGIPNYKVMRDMKKKQVSCPIGW